MRTVVTDIVIFRQETDRDFRDFQQLLTQSEQVNQITDVLLNYSKLGNAALVIFEQLLAITQISISNLSQSF